MIYNVIKADSSLLNFAQHLIADQVKSGDTVIDATVGNGHDTAFLIELVKPHGKVFGFDIQKEALITARDLLSGYIDRACLELIHASHTDMESFIPEELIGKIKAVMFNLGYLPGGNKSIITRSGSTLAALQLSCRLLGVGGVLSVMAYPGHDGGDKETSQVEKWCLLLNPAHYQCTCYENRPDNPVAPKLFCIRKLRG